MKELFQGIIGSLEEVMLDQRRQIKIVRRHDQWTVESEDQKRNIINKERKEEKKRRQRKKERTQKYKQEEWKKQKNWQSGEKET